LYVYLFAVLGQQRSELVDYDPRGQSVVCWRVVDLLALPLNPAEFLMKGSRPVSESVAPRWAMPVELGVVPPEAAPSSASSPNTPESSF
jgi:hypothetical protein